MFTPNDSCVCVYFLPVSDNATLIRLPKASLIYWHNLENFINEFQVLNYRQWQKYNSTTLHDSRLNIVRRHLMKILRITLWAVPPVPFGFLFEGASQVNYYFYSVRERVVARTPRISWAIQSKTLSIESCPCADNWSPFKARWRSPHAQMVFSLYNMRLLTRYWCPIVLLLSH